MFLEYKCLITKKNLPSSDVSPVCTTEIIDRPIKQIFRSFWQLQEHLVALLLLLTALCSIIPTVIWKRNTECIRNFDWQSMDLFFCCSWGSIEDWFPLQLIYLKALKTLYKREDHTNETNLALWNCGQKKTYIILYIKYMEPILQDL